MVEAGQGGKFRGFVVSCVSSLQNFSMFGIAGEKTVVLAPRKTILQ